MESKNFVEIREVDNYEEANSLLQLEEWVLIDSKIEKLRIPIGKEKIGVDFVPAGFFNDGLRSDRMEIKYEERLSTLYVLGRVNLPKQ